MPPRLVKGEREWYILLKYQKNGKMTRRRPTFQLNRIHDITERERRGQELVKKLDWWHRNRPDIEKFDERLVPVVALEVRSARPTKYDVPILEAINKAEQLKTMSDRKQTNVCYGSICRLFCRFIEGRGWEVLKIGEVVREHAVEYLDHCVIERKVGVRTWNNNLRDIKVIFNLLVDRGYIEKNPFNGIPYKKNPKKRRRAFTREEAKAVINVAMETDRLLFYGILLQYACLIRPEELRRLKFQSINISLGTVYVGENEEKTHREKHCTIPTQFQSYFLEKFWRQYPGNWLIFGQGWKPDPVKACGEREMNRRHRVILQQLEKEGKIKDINGLSWYSWKDTGITDLIEGVGAEAARGQANHVTEEMTRRYYHAPTIDERMRDFKSDLF